MSGNSGGGEDATAAHLAAINADATKWFAMSDVLNEMAGLVGSIRIDGQGLSFFGHVTGLTAAYNTALGQLAKLITEGSADFDEVGEKLLKAARNYEDSDERAAARHKFTW
ncbi:hypothetical protein GCM10022225_84990 [Plantactinospora mayteni]|uniref:ESX-1 secretion-associated protein n=1 Tax=Plantactinospora mayteni TaxID=566021 RepID=A0ABQ4F3E7_9ACTN|nr:hypothetical protein [Plantactinospora mayteni]GIH01390.1 hypothetical protein Pma05_79620 [Plantactinospora mayteni]